MGSPGRPKAAIRGLATKESGRDSTSNFSSVQSKNLLKKESATKFHLQNQNESKAMGIVRENRQSLIGITRKLNNINNTLTKDVKTVAKPRFRITRNTKEKSENVIKSPNQAASTSLQKRPSWQKIVQPENTKTSIANEMHKKPQRNVVAWTTVVENKSSTLKQSENVLLERESSEKNDTQNEISETAPNLTKEFQNIFQTLKQKASKKEMEFLETERRRLEMIYYGIASFVPEKINTENLLHAGETDAKPKVEPMQSNEATCHEDQKHAIIERVSSMALSAVLEEVSSCHSKTVVHSIGQTIDGAEILSEHFLGSLKNLFFERGRQSFANLKNNESIEETSESASSLNNPNEQFSNSVTCKEVLVGSYSESGENISSIESPEDLKYENSETDIETEVIQDTTEKKINLFKSDDIEIAKNEEDHQSHEKLFNNTVVDLVSSMALSAVLEKDINETEKEITVQTKVQTQHLAEDEPNQKTEKLDHVEYGQELCYRKNKQKLKAENSFLTSEQKSSSVGGSVSNEYVSESKESLLPIKYTDLHGKMDVSNRIETKDNEIETEAETETDIDTDDFYSLLKNKNVHHYKDEQIEKKKNKNLIETELEFDAIETSFNSHAHAAKSSFDNKEKIKRYQNLVNKDSIEEVQKNVWEKITDKPLDERLQMNEKSTQFDMNDVIANLNSTVCAVFYNKPIYHKMELPQSTSLRWSDKNVFRETNNATQNLETDKLLVESLTESASENIQNITENDAENTNSSSDERLNNDARESSHDDSCAIEDESIKSKFDTIMAILEDLKVKTTQTFLAGTNCCKDCSSFHNSKTNENMTSGKLLKENPHQFPNEQNRIEKTLSTTQKNYEEQPETSEMSAENWMKAFIHRMSKTYDLPSNDVQNTTQTDNSNRKLCDNVQNNQKTKDPGHFDNKGDGELKTKNSDTQILIRQIEHNIEQIKVGLTELGRTCDIDAKRFARKRARFVQMPVRRKLSFSRIADIETPPIEKPNLNVDYPQSTSECFMNSKTPDVHNFNISKGTFSGRYCQKDVREAETIGTSSGEKHVTWGKVQTYDAQNSF